MLGAMHRTGAGEKLTGRKLLAVLVSSSQRKEKDMSSAQSVLVDREDASLLEGGVFSETEHAPAGVLSSP